jgi:hypothetical protein
MLQTHAPRSRRRAPSPGRTPSAGPAGGSVPFDFAARFEMRGEPGRLVQDVITVGPDGAFVATGISYGFEEDCARATGIAGIRIPFNPAAPPPPVNPADIALGDLPAQALIDGVRFNPRFERLIFTAPNGNFDDRPAFNFSDQQVDPSLFALPPDAGERALQRLKRVESLSFLFSIIDSATGRELQDQPIHNLASLGSSQGERPFRLLAKPVRFPPRSTIRLQVIERTDNVRGTLFIVLLGYKLLQACAPPPRPPVREDRVMPFDYVATLELAGVPGRQVETEVPICADGSFAATAIGYGLAVPERGVHVADDDDSAVDLSALTLEDVPMGALLDGFRVRPSFVRLAFLDSGQLATNLPGELANQIFERLNQPEAVTFRYRLFDQGRGIELQSQPINNLAGLGTATGDRPFRQLPVPLTFLPRSTLRVSVEERFGRGTLFIVLQGYRLLEGGRR